MELKEELLEKLPAIPKVIYEVWNVLEKKDVSPETVSRIIEKDITLSAKILRIINSPFYGFPNRITSVKHAVILLGFETIKGLLISTLVFGRITPQIEELWNHACDCATVAGIIGKSFGIKETDELRVSGLLHDMGKVIIRNYFPELDRRITELKERLNCTDLEAEKKVLGVSHTTVNRWIAEKWNFPERIKDSIVFHHEIGSAKNKLFTGIISLSDIICHIYRLDQKKRWIPPIDERICEILGLDEEKIKEILSSVGESLPYFHER